MSTDTSVPYSLSKKIVMHDSDATTDTIFVISSTILDCFVLTKTLVVVVNMAFPLMLHYLLKWPYFNSLVCLF